MDCWKKYEHPTFSKNESGLWIFLNSTNEYTNLIDKKNGQKKYIYFMEYNYTTEEYDKKQDNYDKEVRDNCIFCKGIKFTRSQLTNTR